MNDSSLPSRLRNHREPPSRNDLYKLFYYHLYDRTWNDYPAFQFNPSSPPPNPHRILLIELSSIGDVTYAQPTIESIAKRWPDGMIDFFCEEECSLAVKDHPALENCWTYPFETWDQWSGDYTDRILSELRSTLNILRKQDYDLVINLHWSPFAALTAGFVDADVVSGPLLDLRLTPQLRGNPAFGLAYVCKSRSNAKFPLNPASTKRFLSDSFQGPTEFFASKYPGTGVEKLFREKHAPEKKHLLVNTGSRMENRRWPARHCIESLSQLDPNQYELGLIGGPSDYERLQTIERGISSQYSVVNWFEKTGSLKKDLVLSDCADLTLSTDTGPMHLISIRDNPVLDVAGDIWVGPWNDQSAVIRSKNGEINNIKPGEISQLLNWFFQQGEPPKFDSNSRWYRSPLPATDPWFQYRKQGSDAPSKSRYLRCEAAILSRGGWSRQAKTYGWEGIDSLKTEFHRLRDIFWPQHSDLVPLQEPPEIYGNEYLDKSVQDKIDSVRQDWQ